MEVPGLGFLSARVLARGAVARCLLLLVFAWPLTAGASPETVVHLLDYIGVDYPEFVRNGKVLDAAEYREQQEFAGQVIALLRASAANPRREALIASASRLAERIEAKAPGEEVAGLAASLRGGVIEAYGLSVAPRRVPDLHAGARLYADQCASCHGAQGRGDGPAARGLDPAPANFHDQARMAQRSLYGLYNTITLGVTGTGMAPYKQLDEDQRWALAFYVAALGTEPQLAARGEALWHERKEHAPIGTLHALATLTPAEVAQKYGAEAAASFAWLRAHPEALSAGKESPLAVSRRLLTQSSAAYRAGKREEANRLALAAYLDGFELIEASLDTVDPDLRRQVELQMIGYRDLMRRGASPEQVDAAAGGIDRLLDASAERLAGEALSPAAAAMSSFVILLREGLEALLVVAAIVALLLKAGRRDTLPWIHLGWIGALVAGGLTWLAASALIEVSGATRELTEGVSALAAAAILLYVGVWLHGKRHAHAWQAYIDTRLRGALARGTLWALAGLAFLAVYREAFETVLFYQALWQQAGPGAAGPIGLGMAGAAGVLALLAWLVLRYGLRLPLGAFFTASSLLLAGLAIVFTGHGLRALQEAGAVAATPFGAPDFPALGFYPTRETLIAQLLVFALVAAGFFFGSAPKRR